MTSPPPNTTRGAVAGMLLLSGIVVGAAVGAAIGAAVGALGPLIGVGVLLGFFGGMAAVITRFRDL